MFDPVPQVLRNCRFTPVPGQGTPLEAAAVRQAIAEAEGTLAGAGRVLIRKSGTEPLIRVMAEGDDAGLVERCVGDICAAIEAESRATAAAA
jgi:phosphoglucosamine mutase